MVFLRSTYQAMVVVHQPKRSMSAIVGYGETNMESEEVAGTDGADGDIY